MWLDGSSDIIDVRLNSSSGIIDVRLHGGGSVIDVGLDGSLCGCSDACCGGVGRGGGVLHRLGNVCLKEVS